MSAEDRVSAIREHNPGINKSYMGGITQKKKGDHRTGRWNYVREGNRKGMRD